MKKPQDISELWHMIFKDKVSLSEIDTSLIISMKELFNKVDFNTLEGTISNWNVSNVIDMSKTFSSAKNIPDITKWDVRNVRDMEQMFSFSDFNQDISNWNVSGVENMTGMFGYSNFNQDISNWNIYSLRSTKGMFTFSDFNKDLSVWDTSKIVDMTYMFADTTLEINENTPEWYKDRG